MADSESNLSLALARDRLGVRSVLLFVMSAATPLTMVAGVVTTGYAVTGLISMPLAFAVIGVVLVVFSVGYVAMARHVVNAGAFYAYVGQGLGRPLGVGCAWVALIAYNALQVALYGLIGYAGAPLLRQLAHVDVRWWVIALGAWAIVALLGVLHVELSGKVLALLLAGEIVVILAYGLADVANPAGGRIGFETLRPEHLFGSGTGALLALAVLGFVGFESSVAFSEEARDPRRTVPTATYLSVALIAGLYTFASWAMTVATGPDRIGQASVSENTELIFNLAKGHIGVWIYHVGHALLITSVLAALVSFHNIIARYLFALGRERVLPAALGHNSHRTGSPVVGSIIQSFIGLVVIVGYAVSGWHPLVRLFYWGAASGGLGVLLLILITSVAVGVFFARNPFGENAWRRLIAPWLASAALAVVVSFVVRKFATLLGVVEDSALRWGVPLVYLTAVVIGVLWGMVLRVTRPDVYPGIGLGPRSVVGIQGPV
jgi:amino acid transporter